MLNDSCMRVPEAVAGITLRRPSYLPRAGPNKEVRRGCHAVKGGEKGRVDVQVEAYHARLGLNGADLAGVGGAADAIGHVAARLGHDLTATLVVREDAELVPLGADEEAVRRPPRRPPQLHRGDAAVERHVEHELQPLGFERVDLDARAP